MVVVVVMDISLAETDIPGASLHKRKPENLTVPELKRLLACRGASLSGRKSDLIKRGEFLLLSLLGSPISSYL